MGIEEILIIKDGSIGYGIDTSRIDQILRVPDLTPVVLSSPMIRGLSAVSGNIVTVYDLQMLLGVHKVDSGDESSRLLTLDGSCNALLVSEISDTVLIDERNIEYIDVVDDAVMALYKHHDDIIQILDIELLLRQVVLKQLNAMEIKDSHANRTQETRKSENTERYLFVQMGDEQYAVNIDQLREIIAMPESFTEIAGSRSEMLGLISLRDQLLFVADLRRFFGFDDAISDKNRILVVENGSRLLGLVVDQILDIREVDIEKIDLLPSNFQDQKISGVIRDPKQLISVVGEEVIAQLLPEKELEDASMQLRQNDSNEKNIAIEVVIFRLGKEEYAIDIADVVEIIDSVPVTPFVDAPPLVKGVINIRGQVVTIVSIYDWLGKVMESATDKKIIVCQMQGHRLGFYVDSVSDVMVISHSEIREEKEQSDYFSHVLYLASGTRMALLFDIHQLSYGKEAA